jgi:hypothetical protein
MKGNFWIKYVHLISHLILIKINCITLTIRSKADFKCKSQNIWQQITLFSSTVMHHMRVTQDLNSFGENIAHAQCSVDEQKNIILVYHIRIIAKNNGSHDMKQTDSSIIIVRNVCVLTSASMSVYLFLTRSWSAILGPKLFFTRLWSVIIGTKQPKVNQYPQ